MTNIVLPMAGAGKRFTDKGYTTHKPALPTIYHKTGEKLPMVVCAVKDLPNLKDDGANVVFVGRDFHISDGVYEEIKKSFPQSNFVTVDKLTDGQASTCMLAADYIKEDEELLIAGCDNGMILDYQKLEKEKETCDCLVYTYKNNQAVLENPNAHGWVMCDEDNTITGLSIKKAISDTPMNDHAIVATFWFRRGDIFIEATKKMTEENDRVNGEFYVDKVIDHVMELGYKAKVFEIDRYICWGTPRYYEEYMDTFEYWKTFLKTQNK